MTKLTRLTAKIFGETADATLADPQIGQFGSGKAGTYVGTADVATIQSLPAWSTGWIDAVTPTQQFPALPEMTGVHKVLSYQEAYLLQQGMPEWDANTTYYENNFCAKDGKIYFSKTDSNINNDPTADTVNWEEFKSGNSRSIGEIVTSTIPLTDAGLHLLDGALIDGSGIYSDFVDYIADLYSEEEAVWQQPVLNSNGTMGGVNYACEASSYESDFYAYKAFDNDTSTRWGSVSDSLPDWLTFYSPYPLKVSEVYLDFYQSTEAYSAGEIQGSNDNTNWTTLTSFSNNSSQTLTLSISTNNKYKYIRFYGTSTVGSPWGKVAEFKITATYTKIPNFFTTEENWQSAVTQYGVCGKFVFDSINNTVRLPKTTGIIEGTTDLTALGDLVEAGLPVMTTSTTGDHSHTTNRSTSNDDGGGYFTSGNSQTHNNLTTQGAGAHSHTVTWGATTNTVQPQTIKVLYYIVVATSTKTEIEVDIDEIATDLNGKADVDLTNVNNSGTSKGASWAMPSSTYKDLTLGASGATYTAPANGWFYIQKRSNASGQYLNITNNTNGLSAETSSQGSNQSTREFLPVLKNDVIAISYSVAGATQVFRFIYAQGSESEAS